MRPAGGVRAARAAREGLRLCRFAAGKGAIVVEHGRKPSLGLLDAPALARRILLHLVALDLADTEIVAVGMREIKTGYGRPWPHGEALGELDPGCRLRLEQAEEGALLGVVGLGRIAGRRTNASVFLRDQCRGRQLLALSITPELAARALVHALGEGFRQTVGERLE